MEDRKKTYIADIERGVYDIKDEMKHEFTTKKGLTEEIIRTISKEKNEPEWMLEHRLKSLEVYNSKPMPKWGADLSDLDVDDIIHYLRPDSKIMSDSWDDVPDYIKNTFDRLGIPEAEKLSLAGVGAQYDSEVVYHSIHEELVKPPSDELCGAITLLHILNEKLEAIKSMVDGSSFYYGLKTEV